MKDSQKVIDLWVLLDEQGNHLVADAEEKIDELYAQETDGDASVARRVIHIALTADLPKKLELAATASLNQDGTVVAVE